MDDIVILEFQDEIIRSLQSSSDERRGRTILTILYLVVLGLCFIIPIFYYFRMHCEDRQARRLHERVQGYVLEQRALQDNDDGTRREEIRETRKKYRDEKRARIRQLFEPVRMVLQSHQFHEVGKDDLTNEEEKGLMAEEKGLIKTDSGRSIPEGGNDNSDNQSWVNVYEEQTSYVEIPAQGLGTTTDMRLVPDMCAICLSNYEPGEAIVWSTNSKCEHAFHDECIERWLMKQRGPPLCPCCRADFVIDTLDKELNLVEDDDDLEEEDLIEEELQLQNNNNNEDENSTTGIVQDDNNITPGLNQEDLSGILHIEDLLVDNLSDSNRIGGQDGGGDIEENRSSIP